MYAYLAGARTLCSVEAAEGTESGRIPRRVGTVTPVNGSTREHRQLPYLKEIAPQEDSANRNRPPHNLRRAEVGLG